VKEVPAFTINGPRCRLFSLNSKSHKTHIGFSVNKIILPNIAGKVPRHPRDPGRFFFVAVKLRLGWGSGGAFCAGFFLFSVPLFCAVGAQPDAQPHPPPKREPHRILPLCRTPSAIGKSLFLLKQLLGL